MQTETAKTFVPALESLRGLAAFLVVVHHLPPWFPPFSASAIPFLGNCFLMVDFFFVLSGYVLALNYAHRIGTWRKLGQFMVVRGVRLYPVHLVFLLLFLGLEFARYFAAQRGVHGLNSAPFQWNNLPAFLENLFLVQGLCLFTDRSTTFNGASWSISTEFYTYLLFGLVILFFTARRLVFAACVLALAAAVLSLEATGDAVRFHFVYRCVFGFFVGCLTFSLSRLSWRCPRFVTNVILALFAVWLSWTNPEGSTPVFVTVLFASLLILSIVKNDQGGPEWLLWKPFRFLGVISYSLYMSHSVVQSVSTIAFRMLFRFPTTVVGEWTGPTMSLGAALFFYPLLVAVCLVVGAATYRWVEAPSLHWSKALKKRFA